MSSHCGVDSIQCGLFDWVIIWGRKKSSPVRVYDQRSDWAPMWLQYFYSVRPKAFFFLQSNLLIRLFIMLKAFRCLPILNIRVNFNFGLFNVTESYRALDHICKGFSPWSLEDLKLKIWLWDVECCDTSIILHSFSLSLYTAALGIWVAHVVKIALVEERVGYFHFTFG